MKVKLFLRIASVLMLLHLMGHLVGASTWKNNPDTSIQEVIQGMVSHQFMFMGASQSLAGHHDGYGYASALALLFFSLVLWIVSADEARSLLVSKRIVWVTSVILLLWGIVELIYFFPFAAAFTLAASALCFSSIVLMNRQPQS